MIFQVGRTERQILLPRRMVLPLEWQSAAVSQVVHLTLGGPLV